MELLHEGGKRSAEQDCGQHQQTKTDAGKNPAAQENICNEDHADECSYVGQDGERRQIRVDVRVLQSGEAGNQPITFNRKTESVVPISDGLEKNEDRDQRGQLGLSRSARATPCWLKTQAPIDVVHDN